MPLLPGVVLEGIDCEQLKHPFTLIIPSPMSLYQAEEKVYPVYPKMLHNPGQSLLICEKIN